MKLLISNQVSSARSAYVMRVRSMITPPLRLPTIIDPVGRVHRVTLRVMQTRSNICKQFVQNPIKIKPCHCCAGRAAQQPKRINNKTSTATPLRSKRCKPTNVEAPRTDWYMAAAAAAYDAVMMMHKKKRETHYINFIKCWSRDRVVKSRKVRKRRRVVSRAQGRIFTANKNQHKFSKHMLCFQLLPTYLQSDVVVRRSDNAAAVALKKLVT